MRKSSLYLTDRQKQALHARSAATGRSEAQLLREALEIFLRAAPGGRAPEADAPVAGRFVGVGVGPGDPDLLTVRALAALRRADRILAPSTAVDAVGRAEAILRQAVPSLPVERVAFEMSPSRAARDRSIGRAADAVADRLNAGEEVAWITLGDPLVYSTFAAVAAAVRRRRPATRVESVPGIMAFQALAARTGTVVADEHSTLTIRTALDGDDVEPDLADRRSTVVVYKGGRRLPEIASAASRAGRARGAVVGELLGMPGEQVGPLTDVAARGPASYLATVILPASPAPPASPDGAPGRDS